MALDSVSFDVPEGSIVGLIGPNGAGKTTLFNVITRIYAANSGEVIFGGRSLLDASPHEVVARGLARTFQNVELFTRMTVLDNVLVGLHSRLRSNFLSAGLRLPGTVSRERAALKTAQEIIDYLGLAAITRRPVSGLPFGTLKRVELARALAAQPRLLLLDEPAGGLNHEEVTQLAGEIKRIQRDFRLTLLVVEHHMNLVMNISQRVVVLDFGKRIAEGTPREVQSDPLVIEAYLGTAENGAA